MSLKLRVKKGDLVQMLRARIAASRAACSRRARKTGA